MGLPGWVPAPRRAKAAAKRPGERRGEQEANARDCLWPHGPSWKVCTPKACPQTEKWDKRQEQDGRSREAASVWMVAPNSRKPAATLRRSFLAPPPPTAQPFFRRRNRRVEAEPSEELNAGHAEKAAPLPWQGQSPDVPSCSRLGWACCRPPFSQGKRRGGGLSLGTPCLWLLSLPLHSNGGTPCAQAPSPPFFTAALAVQSGGREGPRRSLGGFGTSRHTQPGLPRQLDVPSTNQWRVRQGDKYQHCKETNSMSFTECYVPTPIFCPPKDTPILGKRTETNR